MCDTMGFLAGDRAYFAKNSDRSPNEPQLVEYHPAHGARGRLKVTYMEIEDAGEANAVLLSRPSWLWGAEMGVSSRGVVIGNEAVFTKGAYGKTGLTGMDLVRLALERGESAKHALEVIAALLERYGQGGNCGYDHDFYYDNSFLILDTSDIYVLETAGRRWAARRYERAAISNRLSLGAEAELRGGGSPAGEDFKAKHLEPVYSFFSGSKQRNASACAALAGASGARDLMRALRAHQPGVGNPLCQNSVGSVCMHAGGAIGDHTTASMVAELGGVTKLWLTGSSTPCVSLFKPYAFGDLATPPVFEAGDAAAKGYWLARERFFRSLIGKALPAEYYEERDALENGWLAEAEGADLPAMRELSLRACIEEEAFYDKWRGVRLADGAPRASYMEYWRRKNAALE
ncbi:MAG TPA: C69 family dipeptidase [Clostridia bacterium]|nr:C69 family dipeptidase [Clostridia bacterium]